MKFKRQFLLERGIQPIHLVPLADVLFVLLIFLILSPAFTVREGIPIALPRTLTSDVIKEEHNVIMITGEDVVYFNDQPVRLEELRQRLGESGHKKQPLMIKADQRTSIGRLVKIWNLCRQLGVERIKIATN